MGESAPGGEGWDGPEALADDCVAYGGDDVLAVAESPWCGGLLADGGPYVVYYVVLLSLFWLTVRYRSLMTWVVLAFRVSRWAMRGS